MRSSSALRTASSQVNADLESQQSRPGGLNAPPCARPPWRPSSQHPFGLGPAASLLLRAADTRACSGRRTPRRSPSASPTASDAGGSPASGPRPSRPSRWPARLRRSARPRRSRRCRRRGCAPVFFSSDQLGQPVRPVERDRAAAAPHGNFATSTSSPSPCAWASVQAAPGDLGIGEDDGRDRLRLEHGLVAGDRLDGHARLVRRLVRQHRLARHVADREDRRARRCGAARSVSMKPLASTFTLRRLEAWDLRVRAAGRRRRARGRTPAPSRRRRPRRSRGCRSPCSSATFTTLVLSMMFENSPSAASRARPTRSRSAPGSSPAVISTTVTLLPSVA